MVAGSKDDVNLSLGHGDSLLFYFVIINALLYLLLIFIFVITAFL
jgi:hypothetical protein